MALTTALTIRAIFPRHRLAVGLNPARFRIRTEIGCIEIVLSGDPDQPE
jgi:hypothetical protein